MVNDFIRLYLCNILVLKLRKEWVCTYLEWVAITLGWAIAMFCKVREFINTMILKPWCFRLPFKLCKYSLGSKQRLHWLLLLLKKSLRIITFECRNAHSNPLFYKHEIVDIENTKKYSRKDIINSTALSWNDFQKYFACNKMLLVFNLLNWNHYKWNIS